MMKKHLKLYILPLVLLLIWTGGCRKAEDLSSRVAEMEFVSDLHKLNGEIDEWIYEHITVPYNIRLQWRWDRSETDLDRAITPVREEQVIPVGQMLLTYYLEPYMAEAGEAFVKRYPPKLYALYGSASYNTNGSQKLGSADAGRKVSLFTINERDFDEFNPTMERILKTVHHEFGHILDQNRRVSPTYGLISNQAHYAEDEWTSVYSDLNTTHLNRGFITPYAGSEPSEDFVEVIATLLAYGQEWFDSQVDRANTEGRAMLREKEGMVVDYFKSRWSIDFRSLQKRISDAKPVPPPPPPPPLLLDFLGEDGTYTYARITYNNVPTEFTTEWTSFNQESVSEADRALSYYSFTPLDDGTMLIRIARFAVGSGTTGSVSFARIFFNIIENPDGTINFTYSQPGTDPFGTPNTAGTQSALRGNSDNLVAFLEGNTFVWDWGDEARTTGGLWVVDTNGDRTGVAMIGQLGNY